MSIRIFSSGAKNSLLLTTVFTVFALLALTLTAQASPVINAVSASGIGTYNNNPGLLINHSTTAEGGSWTSATGVWWYGTAPKFTVDLGSLYTVDDLLVNIDNNDDYKVEYSANNSSWSRLFSIARSYGEVGWGMDTMTSMKGDPEYISGIDFAPVKARYLRISATGGDNKYAVSEIEASGAAVPIPAPACLVALGLVGLLGLRKIVCN